MSYQHILTEKKDSIFKITLNHPERRNPLTLDTIREMLSALDEADTDDAVRVVVITGAGQSFSAGGDLGELSRFIATPAWEHRKTGALYIGLHQRIRKLEKPVIAAVNGPALAGGCGLVAVCDMAVASEDARFGTTEVNVGIFPMAILTSIYRAIGRKKTIEFCFTGGLIDAQEAQRIGLINKVVPAAKLDEAVMELARQLAGRSRVPLSIGKTAINLIEDMGFDQALEYARHTNTIFFSTEDVSEGTKSFLEKRKPVWKDK